MKALTIRQPWATLIAIGVKTIETRSWKAPDALIGERIAIHAGAHVPSNGFAVGYFEVNRPRRVAPCLMDFRDDGRPWGSRTHVMSMPLGAVLATAVLSDCLPMIHDDDWRPEDGYVLLDGYGGAKVWPDGTDVGDQVPYGDFAFGRWAWFLTAVERIDPVPAKGRLGLWEWQP